MRSAALVLEALSREGIKIWSAGDKLIVEPASRLSPALRQTIREQKPALLEALTSSQPANDFAGPSTLAGSGAVLLREWTAGVARLQAARPPALIAAWRWQQVVNDSQRFLGRWANQALALSWRTPDTFGVHAAKPEERFDAAGLVWCLRGASVLAITGRAVQLRTTSGAVQTFTRSEPANPEAITIWSL